MTTDQERQAYQLFQEALARTPPERDTFLVRACADQPLLREYVEKLLRHDEQADASGFLPEPASAADVGPPTGPFESAASEGSTDPVESTVRYQPLRFHKAGGLGEVYLARDEHLQREVALKRIRPDCADEPEYRRRFLREAEITSKLAHPGIVPVFGLAESEDGRPGYAMRFIEGETLHDAIKRFHEAEKPGRDPGERSLALRQLLTHFIAACNAVAYAHSRGVIHRDLKPQNIMLGAYGETLVVDWGLAKQLNAEGDGQTQTVTPVTVSMHETPHETGTGQAIGTPAYMSPEQEAGRWDEVGPASDVYSLGCTLYTILTGKVPHESARQGVVEMSARLRGQAYAALAAICVKALAIHPGDRYTTASDLAKDIECWLGDETVQAYHEPIHSRAARWGRRHRSFMTGLTVLLVTTVLGLLCAVIAVNEERRRTSDAQKQTQDALDVEAKGRRTMWNALDMLTSDIIEEWFAKRESVEIRPEQRGFLERVLALFEKYSEETGEDTESRSRIASACHQVGSIRHRLGYPNAGAAYLRSIELYTILIEMFPSKPEYAYKLAAVHCNSTVRLTSLRAARAATGRGVAFEAGILRSSDASDRSVPLPYAAACD